MLPLPPGADHEDARGKDGVSTGRRGEWAGAAQLERDEAGDDSGLEQEADDRA